MKARTLLCRLADEIGRELWLQDDLIVREVRDADDLVDAKRRLLSVQRDVRSALRILRSAGHEEILGPPSAGVEQDGL